MSENKSFASKYGALFRHLRAEGFHDEWAYELTRVAFTAEVTGEIKLGFGGWSYDELVGSDESHKRQELFDEFVEKLTAIGGDDE